MKTLLLACAMVVSTLSSCVVVSEGIVPSKNYETRQVKVDSFDGISTSTTIDVIYTQTSGNQQIEIYAPDNLMEYIKVNVEGGILHVGFQSDDHKGLNIRGKHNTEVRVSAPAVHSFSTSSCGGILLKNGLRTSGLVTMNSSSSGDIEGGDVVCDELKTSSSSAGDVTLAKAKCNSLKIEASSAGDVTIKDLMAETVEADASSSGDISIAEGTCDNAVFEASSSGDIEAKDLKAKHVKATSSSAGDISCHPIESLKAKTSSAGSVGYRGNPKSIDYSPKKGLHKLD